MRSENYLKMNFSKTIFLYQEKGRSVQYSSVQNWKFPYKAKRLI
jgi:hypothetical protein